MIPRFRSSSRTLLIVVAIVASARLALPQTPAQPEAAPAAVAPAASVAPAAPAAIAAPEKPDALLLYMQGRDLESAGKTAEAQAKYTQSVAVCNQELAQNPNRIESYVVKCWSLLRLGKYGDVISNGQTALKIQFDARISEVMGEAYFFLDQMDDSLKALQRYVSTVGEGGDRFSSAYFFMGEAYLRLKQYNHADMAYSMAVHVDPGLPRWWYRLGMACESLGDYKRAYSAYAKAVALRPSFQEAVDALDRVKPKAGQ